MQNGKKSEESRIILTEEDWIIPKDLFAFNISLSDTEKFELFLNCKLIKTISKQWPLSILSIDYIYVFFLKYYFAIIIFAD
jgi:hypothetical protein